MAKNYYVVKIGRSPCIYTSWEKCKQQVSQYPNAVFKGFNNYSEAQNWLNENDTAKVSLLKGMVAYVDGSYRADTKEYSCGMVVLKNDEVIYRFSKKYQDAAASMRNVAGEISGAKAAMAYAIANNETSLTIYHDYEGIRTWCTGEWKAKNMWTQEYSSYYRKVSKNINISFVKVKGHSGNKYNDEADKLAKSALGI